MIIVIDVDIINKIFDLLFKLVVFVFSCQSLFKGKYDLTHFATQYINIKKVEDFCLLKCNDTNNRIRNRVFLFDSPILKGHSVVLLTATT